MFCLFQGNDPSTFIRISKGTCDAKNHLSGLQSSSGQGRVALSFSVCLSNNKGPTLHVFGTTECLVEG